MGCFNINLGQLETKYFVFDYILLYHLLDHLLCFGGVRVGGGSFYEFKLKSASR